MIAIETGNNKAFVAEDSLGVYDIGEPSNPLYLGGAATGNAAQGLAISTNGYYVFVTFASSGLWMYDVLLTTNELNLKLLGATHGPIIAAGVELAGNYAFVANGPDQLRIYLVMPRLSVRVRDTDSVAISWPVPLSSGFQLQQKPDLLNSNWADVTNLPVMVANRYEVMTPTIGSAAFYRLKLLQ
jgi:hypothetical protein